MIKSKKKSAIRIRRTSLAIQNALLVNEAAVYEKNGNYNKAIFLYNQHHDFLQSYVRTRVEVGSDSKQDPVEPEGLAHPSNDDRNDNDSRDVHNKREKKEKLDPTTIESEMRIQKSKRK
ncbi:hypothetical protein DMN91_012509 [Ooceraea biroi]|uniref:Uncharacterized protein n=1 Tax=Ooceraea biroi TaxID=2015173 RepID=A0A3L8D4Y8_OOCBI|nr:hypothetical protein DMN91_012509 [Ooceraea biroi]